MRALVSRSLALVPVFAMFVLVAGCTKQGSTVLEEPVGETHTTSSATGGAKPQGTDDPRAAIGIVLSDELQRACDLPHHEKAARFSVESTRLRALGDDELGPIARCLAQEKLKDASLQIIGHADPRGADDYSEKLGLHRADATRQQLVSLGLASERMAVSSRGNRDAKGTNEESWALDRKVEIRLAEPRSQAGVPVPSFPTSSQVGSPSGSAGGGSDAKASRPAMPAAPAAPAPAPAPPSEGATGTPPSTTTASPPPIAPANTGAGSPTPAPRQAR